MNFSVTQKMAAISIGGRKQRFVANTISMLWCCTIRTHCFCVELLLSRLLNASHQISIRFIHDGKKCSHLIQHCCHKIIRTKLAINRTHRILLGCSQSSDLERITVHHENEFVCFQIDVHCASVAKWRSARFGF